jgi:FO synthase
MRDAGLSSLPGTAAEILDDEVRAIICPDKIKTDEWLEVMEAARTRSACARPSRSCMAMSTATSMGTASAARAGACKRVPAASPSSCRCPSCRWKRRCFLKGQARLGPTFREAVLMHAVARLALHPLIPNIQTSWVKLGSAGAAACLNAGCNDLGGTLMNESISRAAGASFGQEMPPEAMEELIRSLGRTPRQRTTLYGDSPAERRNASFDAAPLLEPINTPARKYERAAAE